MFSDLRDEVEFASVDSSTSVLFTLKHDAALKEEDKVHLQLATLYTNNNAQRTVRVHNMSLISSAKPSIVFRNSDIEAVVVALSKTALVEALHHPLSDEKKGPRTSMYNRTLEILHTYRVSCSPNSPRAQLILPESLKVLPIYTLGLLKHPALLENTKGTGLTPSSSSGNLASKGRPLSGGSFHLGGGSQNGGSQSGSPKHGGSQNGIASLSRSGSSSNLLAAGGGGGNSVGALVKMISIRGTERAHEIRKLINVSITDVINSLYPRMYCLYALFDNEGAVDNSLGLSADSVGDCYDDFYNGHGPNTRETPPGTTPHLHSMPPTPQLHSLSNQNMNNPSNGSSHRDLSSFQRGSSLRNVFGNNSSLSSMGEQCLVNKDQLR